MAFQIKYARLFECRIWHGYYLHQGDRQNFHNFDFSNADDLLDIQNILSRYDINQVFDIRPLGETRSIMTGHRIKAAFDNTGFFVGISVKPNSNPNFFDPHLPLDDGLSLQFGLRLTDPGFFTQVTNERMRTNVPAIYYFTNLLAADSNYVDNALTTISRQYPAYQNRRYEMGELVHDGTNLYRSLTADSTGLGTNTNLWEVADPPSPPPSLPNNNFENRFEVNNSDLVLLPALFNYTFTPLDGVVITDATITLVDSQNNVVQTDVFTLSAGQTQVPLDYSDISSGWYQLNTTATGGYATSQFVYLNDELYDRNLWGVIEIGHQATLSAANSVRRILESDGSLRHTALATETPVFHIRVPNRYTYWRYKVHPSQSAAPLVPTNNTALIVGTQADILVTAKPQPNTQFGVKILYDGNGTNAHLPSPVVAICRPEEDGLIYSDVHLGILPI